MPCRKCHEVAALTKAIKRLIAAGNAVAEEARGKHKPTCWRNGNGCLCSQSQLNAEWAITARLAGEVIGK